MKYLYAFIISVVLLESCNITKRRYLPGFSINWKHGAPKTIVNKNNAPEHSNHNHFHPAIIAAKPMNILTEDPLPDLVIPTHFETFHISGNNNLLKNTSFSKQKESLANPLTEQNNLSGDPIAHEDSNKEVCSQAKASSHLGMFGFTLILLSVSVWLGLTIIRNSGGLCATAKLANTILISAGIAGGILGLLAIIFGIIALHKIHAEEGKYTGTGKAISGMVFALILFGILALLLAS